MSRIPGRALVIATLIALGETAAGVQKSPADADPAVLAAFDALTQETRRAPAGSLTSAHRQRLLDTVRAAEAAYRQDRPCDAATTLGGFLQETQALRRDDRTGVVEGLYNQGRSLQDDILAAARATTRCPETRPVLDEPGVDIRASDNKNFAATIRFGAPRFLTRRIGGEVWTDLTIPGLRAGMDEGGTPAVPAFRRLIGVPAGAQAELVSARPRVAESIRMNLIPFQALRHLARVPLDGQTEPPPSAYFDGPFEKDPRAYDTNAPFPSSRCRLGRIGQARDLSLAVLECAAGQYNPVTDQMTLFDTVEVDVAFRGGTGQFITTDSLSPFEPTFALYRGATLNRDAIGRFVGRSARRVICSGEELLILTHPDFRPAADSLAQWKQAKGIATSVFNVNDGAAPGPNTSQDIDAFIEQRYNTCLMRVSYLLLLGDVDRVPTFVVPRRMRADAEAVATDFPYACQPSAFCDDVVEFGLEAVPSFAVGRISAVDLPGAQAIVGKIIAYETAPIADASFYQNATVAADFECCRADLVNVPDPNGWEDVRAFVQNAEFARAVLAGRGYVVQRIYSKGTDYHPEYTGLDTPRYYSNGATLPPPLRPVDLFPWDGDASQIAGAFHKGRFLFVHLDHGLVQGWVAPSFKSPQASALMNGQRLPVVFSLNCSSGAFDRVTPIFSFAETLLANPAGGAVGVFAFSREAEASSFPLILQGAFDAAWPDLLPQFGDPSPRHRLGDFLVSSQLRILSLTASPDPAVATARYTMDHVRMLHLFGDPTVEMWTANPPVLPGQAEILVGREGPEIFYDVEGAVITGFQQTDDGLRPIGRDVVRNGVARLTFQPLLPGVPLFLSASLTNAVSTPLAPSVAR
jgi:hypothetical protein